MSRSGVERPAVVPQAGAQPWTRTFCHVGQVVSDISAAMDRLSATFGMRWSPLLRYPRPIRMEGRDTVVELAVTMSLDGPFHLELLEEIPGSVWERSRGHPVHHVCYWVPDLLAEASRLCADGWCVDVTGPGPLAVNGFAYLVGPDGFRVEPKAEPTRPAFERWLAGGSLSEEAPA